MVAASLIGVSVTPVAGVATATFSVTQVWNYPTYSGTVHSDFGHAGNYTSSTTAFTTLQGGTSDGSNVYFIRTKDVAQAGGKNYQYGVLLKARLSDGALLKSNPTPVRKDANGRWVTTSIIGHGNDILYKSDTNRIFVPGWKNDDTVMPPGTDVNKRMKGFGAADLGYDKSLDFPNVFNAAYYDGTGSWVTRNGGTLRYYNTNYQQYRSTTISQQWSNGVWQGIDCTANAIYVVETKGSAAAVHVINFSGQETKVWTSSNVGGEAEHIFHVGKTFYLGVGNLGASAALKKTSITP
ncbi:MAG: hypothetical protein LBG70_01165 [Bifidobacteriaceae bacterium]|jgi:hypothetical protein|nr:hypothetical protein [Bifidobacteriaceae bacterium]